MTNWTQQLREAYCKLKEGNHDDIQAARLQRKSGIDLGIRKVMPEQEGLTPEAIEAQKRRMAQQQKVIDRLEGGNSKTMSEDVTLGRLNLSTLGRSVKQGLQGLGRRLVGKGGRQSTLGKQYPPTGLKLYSPTDPYVADPLTKRVPNVSALPKGMFAEPDLSKPHLSGNRPTEHEKTYWADLPYQRNRTIGENGIRAVAQTYLQEQQLREQAEYIAVLENTIVAIAEQIGVEPQQLIQEANLVTGKEAVARQAKLAKQRKPLAVKAVERQEDLGDEPAESKDEGKVGPTAPVAGEKEYFAALRTNLKMSDADRIAQFLASRAARSAAAKKDLEGIATAALAARGPRKRN